MKKILLVGVLALSMPFALLSSSNSVTITNNTPLDVLPKFVTSTDQSFGTAGTVTQTTFTSGLTITSKFVEAVPDGYVVAGDYWNGSGGGVVILKYTFIDVNGVKKTKLAKEVYPGGDTTVSMVKNNDDKIFILTQYSAEAKVIAFDSNLNYVRSFGTDGYQTVGTHATAFKMVADEGSLFVIADDGANRLYKNSASTGTPDSSFTTQDLTTVAFTDSVADLTVSNDNVIVAGKATGGNTFLKAYSTDTGAQDMSFGTGGVATTGSTNAAVAIEADPSTGDIYLLRQGATVGSVAIQKFDDGGTLLSTFAPGNVIGTLSDILVTPEATYVVATNGTNDGVIAVVQNNELTIITNTALNAAAAATIGTDGKLIVAGNDASNAGLWRVNLPVSNPIISNNINGYGLAGSPV